MTTWTGEVSTPLRFPGQYLDPETGWHYNRHRYYQPHTGRYTTPDPLGLAPAPNPHTNPSNPTNAIDPLGLIPCPEEPAGRADSFAARVGLERQLARQLATSVFNPNGTPHPHVIAASRPIIGGADLANRRVIDGLTADGSSIGE
ncbi:RHS repeat-associated core domain-containing protein [Mycobacterium camsae]|uniref:RHS repeat-associated core domain-containing protein n=1 Tax=Mycobacterium gordonae TaxID=1778 RepID=UPI00197DB503|nr:RHS repeat-associated core domain-containing protein [Mycobacterium gordonae]